MSSQKKISYKSSGVDIVLGEKLVETIKPLAKKTFRKEVINEMDQNNYSYFSVQENLVTHPKSNNI